MNAESADISRSTALAASQLRNGQPKRAVKTQRTQAGDQPAKQAALENSAIFRGLSLIAKLPLKRRRQLLRLCWRASLLIRKDVGFGLEPLLAQYLRISSTEARIVAIEHDFHDILQIMEWISGGLRNKQGIIADFNLMHTRDADLVERIAGTGDSVILAPMHMGIFPMGISYMLWKYFPGRRVLVLRAREDHEENNAAMARLREISSEVRILNTRNEEDFMDAMRFARKGAVVISMVDLPETYGKPVDTKIFGHDARIAFGLDAMARMLKAVVLPMTLRSGLSGDEILIGQPFEVWTNSKDDRGLLAGEVGKQIESFVKIDPCQWHMWTRILEFFPGQQSAPVAALTTSNEKGMASNEAA